MKAPPTVKELLAMLYELSPEFFEVQPEQKPVSVRAKFLAENIVESINCWDFAGAKATLEMLTALAQPEYSVAGYCKKIEALIVERDALKAALAQPSDALDAARYRWLRDPCSDLASCYYSRGDYGRGLKNTTMLDEAVDAELEERNHD